MCKNRIVHISIDQELNSQVNFDGDELEEAIHSFFSALGIEVVVTSEDEEVPEVNNG
jgi:hypothetical protein